MNTTPEAIQLPTTLSVLTRDARPCQFRSKRLQISQGSVLLRTSLSLRLNVDQTKLAAERQQLLANDAPQPMMHLLYRMTPVEFATHRKALGLKSRGGRPKMDIDLGEADALRDLASILASRLIRLPLSTLVLLLADDSPHNLRTLWQVLQPLLTDLVASGRLRHPGDANVA